MFEKIVLEPYPERTIQSKVVSHLRAPSTEPKHGRHCLYNLVSSKASVSEQLNAPEKLKVLKD
ncbi:MAG: hypothetical protein K2Y32_16220 [Candidatus Obscuribacterales bacterium]|nr:hypothetical protein [Candidatus Obscuribacterales bacterium]